jgi:hypothetical protein
LAREQSGRDRAQDGASALSDSPRRPGRRKRPPEEKQGIKASAYVTEAEFDAIAVRAIREGISISEWIRDKVLESLGISHPKKWGG